MTQNALITSSLADLAAHIRTEHEAAVSFVKRGLERAINCGALLIAAKAHIATVHGGSSHGHWLPWLQAECGFPERTAPLYMRLANHAGELAEIRKTADLTIEGALKTLAKPKLIEISDAAAQAAFTEAAADYLPTQDGMARIGELCFHNCYQSFGVKTDSKHAGYFHIAQLEAHGNGFDDFDGAAMWCEPNGGRPVRADFVKDFFLRMMRRPDHFDEIEWRDHPANLWPFPEPKPRWPAWEVGAS
jgi:hypothetical protein